MFFLRDCNLKDMKNLLYLDEEKNEEKSTDS